MGGFQPRASADRIGVVQDAGCIYRRVRREEMDENRARVMLQDERIEVLSLLKDAEAAGQADRETEDEEGVDASDPAQSLTAEGMDDAIAESLRDRLAAIDRPLRRPDDGPYRRSVRSGGPLPDKRPHA